MLKNIKKIFQDKRIQKILLTVVSIYSAVILFIYYSQDKFIYDMSKIHLPEGYKYEFTAKFIEKNHTTNLGYKINYLVFEAPKPRGVILYFHGNAYTLKRFGHVAQKLMSVTGMNVWVMDYPGFGKSDEHFVKSQIGLIEMGLEFVNLIKNETPDIPLYLYGKSFGTGVASGVAARTDVAGVVLETPYISTVKMAQERMPFVPSVLLNVKLDNTELLKSSTSKILIFHGKKDGIIPYAHAEELSRILGERADFITFPDGKHENLDNYNEYWTRLKEFLN